MNKINKPSRKRHTRHRTGAVKASSQTTFMRNALFAIMGLGIMLLILSRFSWGTTDAPQMDHFAITIPPVADADSQNNADNMLPDYNMNTQLTVALAETTNPQLEENIDLATTSLVTTSQASPPNANWHEYPLQKGDNLTAIFNRHRLGHFTLKQILQQPHSAQLTQYLRAGNTLRLLIDDRHRLHKLMYDINNDETLVITKRDGKFHSEIKHRDFNEEVTFKQGLIQKSRKHTLRDAKVSDRQWLAFAKIFSGVVDFRRDLKVNDRFEILYKKYRFNDNSVRSGDIIGAKLITRKKTYTAVYFESKPGKQGNYYSPNGDSLHQSFTRSPLVYKRVSSPFNLNRMHPILQVKRPHEGVDLAAPRGTIVKAVGDARVKAAGTRGGYGKVVELDHGNGITTLYAHLSRFAKKTKQGSYVKKGDIIAYVGSTGLATGPHLHYEYRINGKPKNPLNVHLPKGKRVAEADRPRFITQANRMQTQFAHFEGKSVVASASAGSKTN